MLFGKYKRHVELLRSELVGVENEYVNNKITLRHFVDTFEDQIRNSSHLNIHLGKLFNKYIVDFCDRYAVETYPFQNRIRNYRSKYHPEFDGEWYFSEVKRR